MSEAFDMAKAAELEAKAELVAAGVPLAAPTTEPRKRRTAEERLAAEREKIAALEAKVNDRAAKEAQRAAKEELARKRKVLAGLDAVGISYAERGLDTIWRSDPHAASDPRLVKILSDLRGEVAGE